MHFRWACNKRFRKAMTTFADNSRHASPWAAKIYSDARASGKDHLHAVRVLARAWIRVIWPCWLNHTPYDPARHGPVPGHRPQHSVMSLLRLAGCKNIACVIEYLSQRLDHVLALLGVLPESIRKEVMPKQRLCR